MAAVATPDDGTALAGRVWILEHDQTKIADKLSKVDDTVDAHSLLLAAQHEQIGGLTKAVDGLSSQMSKLLWALIGLSLTITGSAVATILHFG